VNACPVCPWTNDISCSVSNHTNEPLCWNTEHCQRSKILLLIVFCFILVIIKNFFLVCPPECGNLSCTEDGVCCHEQCLGGCTGTKQNDCFACKYLEDERDCVKECPAETLIVSNNNTNQNNDF